MLLRACVCARARTCECHQRANTATLRSLTSLAEGKDRLRVLQATVSSLDVVQHLVHCTGEWFWLPSRSATRER
jgi:hypothetical protein